MPEPRTYTEAELLAYAEAHIFPQQPDLTKLLATHDGQFFTERAKNDATNYARQARLDLVVIERMPQGLRIEPAASDDPGVRDVQAVMQALECTAELAAELVEHYKGNVEVLVAEQRRIRAAVEANTLPAEAETETQTPAAPAKARRKPKTT